MPIVGRSSKTPIWHARPNFLEWSLPLPSITKKSGVRVGEVSICFLTNSTIGSTSLNAKNPGIYGVSEKNCK